MTAGDHPESLPTRRRGAARDANVPRMEDVRATAPDVDRRATMERTRGRTVIVACVFAALFAVLSLQLAIATVIRPHLPRLAVQPELQQTAATTAPSDIHLAVARTPTPPAAASLASVIRARRAMITDRNGEVLALSVPTYNITVDPRDLIDPAEAARRLKSALPQVDEAVLRARLADPSKSLVYVARSVAVREQNAVRALRLPGVAIEPTERRRYPFGPAAAHVLGGVGADGMGLGGVEMRFNDRLLDTGTPLRLSLDVRVQDVVRDELQKAMTEFSAIGGCGLVMDVHTGELMALVSLPDFDPGQPRSPKANAYLNRCTYGLYEPGSTFKLQTAAMSLDSGLVHIWNGFDATNPIRIGRFTINDFEGKHRYLQVPEIIAYSSNIGAARMAESVGSTIQRAWMQKMGMFARTAIELPESRVPQFPSPASWGLSATLTVAFGHGISVTPLHVVTGTSAIANGGVFMRPTLLAADLPKALPSGTRVMQQTTSDTLRKLMRLVVTDGFGKSAEVPGYYIGGKTGTAEKNTGHGYEKHANVASFMAVFPMNAPRYAVYLMLDEPKATASTHGYATAGWVAAPAVGRVIDRAAPLMGMQPDIANAATIQAQLAIPLQPGKGPAITPRPPALATSPTPIAPPVTTLIPASMPARDLRQQIMLRMPDHAGP